MAIVSISEAARITGKARSTIQSYIKTGKLSKTTDVYTGVVGVDTSELIRYFGGLTTTPTGHVVSEKIIQKNTPDTTVEINQINLLEKEIELLKQIIVEKDEHNKSLKQAMLMLEHKEQKKETSSSWFTRLFTK